MRLTVKQALSIEGLNRCKVVAGKNGLSREISCVDTMEIRDIGPWLKEKELLLTTGYSIQGDSAKLIELIESLHNVGAAGIAIKTRFWGTLPEEALALAEKLSIPVITIPDEMPFVDLLMPLIQAILDIQNEMLKFSSKIHNQFTELELSGGGLEGIVNMLYELLSMPAIITDRNLKIITSAPETIDLCNIFENIHTDLQLWANDSNTNSDVKEIRSDQYYVVGRKARFKGDVCSYILIFCSEARFSEMHMVVLDHAATTAALEYSKQDAIRQRLSRMDNNCFIDIIMRNIKSEAEAQHRAQNLGWQSPPFSLVVCDINNFEENIRGKSEMEILSLKQQVEEYIRHIMLKEKILCTIISKSDSFSSLCASVNADELVAIGRMIVKHVQEKLNIKLYVGVSTQVGNYTDLWKAYEEATDALRIGRKKLENVVFIEDVQFERAVMRDENKTYYQQFLYNTVAKLEEYDRINNTDLMHTLLILVENIGVRSKTAEALFLHRNTLLSRIRRIEEITGSDLSQGEKLIEFGIAMKLRSII